MITIQIVGILTDFGLSDSYLAEVKATIIKNAPTVNIIDICNTIDPGDIWGGAWILNRAVGAFPKNTVYLGIVDPGVGSSRSPIAMKSSKGYFVGPDNGLLSLAANRLGFQEVRKLENSYLWRTPISPTFHGRDIFAPVAGFLAAGGKFEKLGRVQSSWKTLKIPIPLQNKNDEVEGQILWIDRFGTLITNIRLSDLNDPDQTGIESVQIRIKNRNIEIPWVQSYSETLVNSPCILLDSDGWISLAINQGSAKKFFKVNRDDQIHLKIRKKRSK